MPIRIRNGSPAIRFLTVLGVVIAATTTVIILESRGFPHDPLIGEIGIIEQSSVLFWFVSSIILIASRSRPILDRLPMAYLAAMMGFRELDAHKRIFDWNISKLLNLVKPDFPLVERLGALFLIIVPLTLAALTLISRWAPAARVAYGSDKRWIRYVIFWLVLLVLAIAADKFTWPLGVLGIEIDRFPIHALEESVEMGLALFTVMASIAFFKKDLSSPVQ